MVDTSHMKVSTRIFSLKDIASGYKEDPNTNAVIGMDGYLDIRPKYQREFRYDKEKQDKLIQSVLSNYPISIMYWVLIGYDDAGNPKYEVLDGQQRLISICRFITQGTTVSFNGDIVSYAGNPDAIDDYDKLTIYVCEKGATQSEASFEKEKLAWFETINIAGATLTKQEIRSALKYSDWCTSAKSHFVHKDTAGTTAYSYGVQRQHRANDYFNIKNTEKNEKDKSNQKGNSDSYQKQEVFEKILQWVTGNGLQKGTDEDIVSYMEVRKDATKYPDASELWKYFTNVMDWVWEVFEGDDPSRYSSYMKNVEWGLLYNTYYEKMCALPHGDYEDTKKKIRERVDQLSSFEVNQSAKYAYVLDEIINGQDNADRSVLSLRTFSPKDAERMYAKQHGICPGCGRHFSNQDDMEADHIVPWSKGGFTNEENLQMLCADCNGKKLANEHFGQIYSRNEVCAFSKEEIAKCPEGKLKVKQ